MDVRIKRTKGGVYAMFKDGTMYDLVEGIVPGSGCGNTNPVTADILFVMGEDGDLLDWIYGAGCMEDKDIEKFCMDVRENREKKGPPHLYLPSVVFHEVSYTGGGIYCVFGKLSNGEYFGGDFCISTGFLTIYKTFEAAETCSGDEDDVARYLDDDEPLALKIWDEVYDDEIRRGSWVSDVARAQKGELEKKLFIATD